MKQNLLERVTVGFRCPMNWDEMSGEGAERFCQKCEKSVTDLSQMSAEEVTAFVEEEGPRGKACIRLIRDDDGQLVVKGCGSSAMVAKEVARKAATGAALAGGLALASCSSTEQEPTPLMGVMCVTPDK